MRGPPVNTHEKPRVLVVEVDEPTAGLLKDLLAEKFFAEVTTATSLRAARGMLAGADFDVVTLGYLLPDGTGLDLLSEITSIDGHPPVIMVTGHGNEEIASWAVRDGAFGYVLKNDGMEVRLSDAVRRALDDERFHRVEVTLKESESFYHSLFEESANALFIETLEGVIEDANRSACSMLGYEPGELRGMAATELIPRGRTSDFEMAQGKLLAGESVEFENLRKDGSVIPVVVSAEEVITRRGPRYVLSVHDLSDVKRAEERAEQEFTFSEQLLNTLPEIFILIDQTGKIVRWNTALGEVCGYTDEEIASLSYSDFHPREELQRIGESLEKVLMTGEPERSETLLMTKDGRAIPYELTGALVRNREGNPVAIAGLGRDVTERRRTEDALHNMIRETNQRREEITALLESTRLVLGHERFEETAHDIFYLCKNLVGAGAGFVALISEKLTEVVIVDPESLRDDFLLVGHLPLESLAGRGFEPGKPFIENAVASSPLAEHLPEGRTPLQNFLLSPLIIGGETVGLMGLANKPGGFDKRDALMASAFGEIVSIALQNSHNLKMLQDSEERFRSVAETANEAIICADHQGDITFWNPGAQAMFGYTADEAAGRQLTMILPERTREERLKSFIGTTAQGTHSTAKTYDIPGLRKDGSEFFMELSRSAPWVMGDELYVTVTIRDIAARKEAEEALRESEQKYRLLFDTAPDVIYSISTEGIITALNTAFENWTGFSRDEWVGKPFAPIVHPDDLEKATETFVQATGGRRPVPYELRILKKDGDYITAEFISAPLLSHDEIVGEFGIARDVTERKAAQMALAESEEMYRGLLATSPDPVVVTDLDFKVTMVSDRAVEQQRAQSPGELIGINAREVLMPEGIEKARREAAYALETGIAGPEDFTLTRRDGTTFIGELTTSLLRDPGGDPKAFMAIVRDITERKRVEHELQMLNNELEGYAHAVSHDLKGPLSSIGAASITIQSLLKGELAEEDLQGVVEMAAIIEGNVEKSNQLIEDLLELAEAGQRPMDPVDVDISKVIEDILAERRDIIKAKHVKVKVDGHLGTIRASRTHMYQLFSNLIENAVKHNDSRKPLLGIKYSGKDELGGHQYRVMDNGPGIDPADAHKIFLPFVSGIEGESGVGLATVEKIVGVYGGTIDVCNEGGACFDFVIHDAGTL